MEISRRAILKIAKTLVGSIINKIPIQQQLLEKLAEILCIKRCALFRLSDHGIAGACNVEIIAGVPINEHGIGLKEPISRHPDIEDAVRKGKVNVITNPKESSFTAHFRQIIEQKDIEQILYLPLISEFTEKTIGVIVVDATGEKTGFESDEIEFCGEVGELISLVLHHEEILVQQMRDLIVNRILPLGGFGKRLQRLSKEFSKDVDMIVDEIKKAEEVCPKGGRINF